MRYSNTLNILHENNFGHIAKCRCCLEIQVKLGNVMLTFSMKEFFEFDSFFNEIRTYIQSKEEKTPNQKFIVKTKMTGIDLNLSYLDLIYTVNLLDNAKILFMVKNLLK